MGFKIEGIFIAGEPRKNRDGYHVSISCGIDTYLVSVPAIPSGVCFGDAVCLTVRPNVYNGRLYFSGEFVEKGV